MAFDINDYLATQSVPYAQQQQQQQDLTTYEQQAYAGSQPATYDPYTGYPSAGVPETKYTPPADQPSASYDWQSALFGNKTPAASSLPGNSTGSDSKSLIQTISESTSDLLKKHGGEIFVNAMGGSAAAVLKFLADRRAQRRDSELIDKRYQYGTQAKNADVARASAMPTMTSVVKPGVSGKQLVGSQRQTGGLINATRQRSA